MTTTFLAPDGFLNTEAFIELAREIDKFATSEGMKPSTIYFTPKIVPKFDKAKAKAGGDAWTKKRALVVKTKSRAPVAGSRMRMVVQLRLYKGIEDPELGFNKDIAAALKAIAQHNKTAERIIASMKKEGAKVRERAAKEFDKNIDCVINTILKVDDDVIDGVDYAVGTSMMGKTLIVKLPNGGFVSIGKSDAEKFKKARESANASDEEAAPARRPRSSAKAAPAAPVKRSRAAKEEAAPAAPTRRKPSARTPR